MLRKKLRLSKALLLLFSRQAGRDPSSDGMGVWLRYTVVLNSGRFPRHGFWVAPSPDWLVR